MVTPFLIMPFLAAVTPERTDAPFLTSSDAECSGGTFLAELQKALTPDPGEATFKNTEKLATGNLEKAGAIDESAQEISAEGVPAENVIHTDYSDVFKSISLEKKSPAALCKKEKPDVVKTAASRENAVNSGPELPSVAPEKIAQILAAYIFPQPAAKPENLLFKNAEAPLPAGTSPSPEILSFTFDALPHIPVRAASGEPILKAEMPVMPEAEAAQVFEKLGESLEKINKELAKQGVFKSERFSAEKFSADVNAPVNQSADNTSPELTSTSDFNSEVRVLKGPVISMEVVLADKKIVPENKIHVGKSEVHVGKTEVHVEKTGIHVFKNENQVFKTETSEALKEIHVGKSEGHVGKTEVHVEKTGIRVFKNENPVLKTETSEALKEIHVGKSEIHVGKSEVHVGKSEVHVGKTGIHVFKNETSEKKPENEEFQRQNAAPPQKEIPSQKADQNGAFQPEIVFPHAAPGAASPVLKTAQPGVLQTEIVHVRVANFTEKAAPAIQQLEKSEGGTMRLVLMPEALGQVKLEVVVENKVHTAITIQVENTEAKKQIEAQMPVLKEQLVQSGMVIDKINVEVKSDFKNLSQFAGFQQQQQKGEEREGRKKFVDSFKYLRETAGEESGDVRQFIEQYV